MISYLLDVASPTLMDLLLNEPINIVLLIIGILVIIALIIVIVKLIKRKKK